MTRPPQRSTPVRWCTCARTPPNGASVRIVGKEVSAALATSGNAGPGRARWSRAVLFAPRAAEAVHRASTAGSAGKSRSWSLTASSHEPQRWPGSSEVVFPPDSLRTRHAEPSRPPRTTSRFSRRLRPRSTREMAFGTASHQHHVFDQTLTCCTSAPEPAGFAFAVAGRPERCSLRGTVVRVARFRHVLQSRGDRCTPEELKARDRQDLRCHPCPVTTSFEAPTSQIIDCAAGR